MNAQVWVSNPGANRSTVWALAQALDNLFYDCRAALVPKQYPRDGFASDVKDDYERSSEHNT